MNIYLLLIAVAVVAGVIGALSVQRRYNNIAANERAMRRAAQARCADLQAQRDLLAYDGVKLRALAADFYATWAETDADADRWWERYSAASEMAHDYACQLAAAKAHDAEVLDDPIDETPMLREIEAVCPVSPAPVCDFASPTGSWRFADIQAAIGGSPVELAGVNA